MNELSLSFSLLPAWALASARLTACWVVVPIFGRNWLSGVLRAAPILATSAFFIPLVLKVTPQLDQSFLFMALLLKEVAIGVLLGVAIGTIFWTVEAAGGLIDAQSGTQAGAMLNPLSGAEEGIFATLMYWAFAAYFISLGGLLWIFGAVANSYSFWPPGSLWPSLLPWQTSNGVQWWLMRLDELLRDAFTLASPVMAAMLVIELSLGLVGRFTPQLQVFFVAIPLKLLTAFGVLAIQMAPLLRRSLESMGPYERFLEHLLRGGGV